MDPSLYADFQKGGEHKSMEPKKHIETTAATTGPAHIGLQLE